jgi:hypothetical protein
MQRNESFSKHDEVLVRCVFLLLRHFVTCYLSVISLRVSFAPSFRDVLFTC